MTSRSVAEEAKYLTDLETEMSRLMWAGDDRAVSLSFRIEDLKAKLEGEDQ